LLGFDPGERCRGGLQLANMSDNTVSPDFEYHYETYRAFVKYGLIFVAHVVVILALLAYFLG
jgi:Bacterial aa3 type cytochrome c oxidase subunit IV